MLGPLLQRMYYHCVETVTVYHEERPGVYHRVVIDGAFLDIKKTVNIERTGSREVTGFLLVIPEHRCRFIAPHAYAPTEGTYTLAEKDKVIAGVGPEIATAEAWAALIPAKVDGLVVIKQVDPKFWLGERAHVEASG